MTGIRDEDDVGCRFGRFQQVRKFDYFFRDAPDRGILLRRNTRHHGCITLLESRHKQLRIISAVFQIRVVFIFRDSNAERVNSSGPHFQTELTKARFEGPGLEVSSSYLLILAIIPIFAPNSISNIKQEGEMVGSPVFGILVFRPL